MIIPSPHGRYSADFFSVLYDHNIILGEKCFIELNSIVVRNECSVVVLFLALVRSFDATSMLPFVIGPLCVVRKCARCDSVGQ